MKRVKNIFIGIFITIFFIFAILLSLLLLNKNEYGFTQFGDTTLVVVNNKMSSNKYKSGDLLLIEKAYIENLKVGDELFTYKRMSDKSIEIAVGKVGEIFKEDNALAYENGSQFTMPFVVGEVSDVYSGVGKIMSLLSSTWVFLFIIVLPCFLIFIYQIYALIVEIKYGSEDDEEEYEEEEEAKKTETKEETTSLKAKPIKDMSFDDFDI